MADAHDELFLIDGNSLAYRAFFALPESIATSTGEPTNAIFGFASMLVKIVTDFGMYPTVVAWDAGTSGRTELSGGASDLSRLAVDLGFATHSHFSAAFRHRFGLPPRCARKLLGLPPSHGAPLRYSRRTAF